MLIKTIENVKVYVKKTSYMFVDGEEKYSADIVDERNRLI